MSFADRAQNLKPV